MDEFSRAALNACAKSSVLIRVVIPSESKSWNFPGGPRPADLSLAMVSVQHVVEVRRRLFNFPVGPVERKKRLQDRFRRRVFQRPFMRQGLRQFAAEGLQRVFQEPSPSAAQAGSWNRACRVLRLMRLMLSTSTGPAP